MRTFKIICLFLFAASLSSCHRYGVFSFDDIEYITDFGERDFVISEHSRKVIDLGIEGIHSLKVYGPYLFVSTYQEDGQLMIFEKKSPYRCLGKFFHKGNGPGELVYPVTPSSFVFNTDEDGRLTADFNSMSGHVVRFHVSESIAEGRTIVENLSGISRRTFSAVNLGEDGFFYKEMTDTKDAQIRYIVKDGEKIITKSMERLNSAVIRNKDDDGSRFNVLSGGVKYNSSLKRFAETPGEINAIHMYSLDDSYARTFCFGKKLYDFNEIADRESKDRPTTSICTRENDDFVMVLYVDATNYEYYTNENIKPSIIMLPWNGGAPNRIRLPDRLNAFDFDEEKDGYYTVAANIYGYDSSTETIVVYDMMNM